MAAWTTVTIAAAHANAIPANSGVRIHRYAAFDTQAITDHSKRASASSSSARLRTTVKVYGKQLTLSLEHNTQLIVPSIAANSIMLRGTLEGTPASWVRLTRVMSGTYGLIWDGSDLYAIEPSGEIREALANSLDAPNSDTVIFKLSDTTVDLGSEYCASAASENSAIPDTGLATYQALTADLVPQRSDAVGAPTLRMEMQVLADAAFRAQYTSDQAALDAIMVRLNNVDGIYSSQVGLAVQATDIQVFAHDPNTLSTSTSADTLINSLGRMRANSPSMRSYAATHLFTGRDLDGDTVGTAYVGNICGARYAVSLSEIRNRGAWIDSLVMAHELGHQLGAVHDGTGVCSGTAEQGYLMSTFINGNEELSQCSRDTILATMQQAACLVPLDISSDVSATENSSPQQGGGGGGGGAFSPAWLLILAALAGRACQLRCRST